MRVRRCQRERASETESPQVQLRTHSMSERDVAACIDPYARLRLSKHTRLKTRRRQGVGQRQALDTLCKQ